VASIVSPVEVVKVTVEPTYTAEELKYTIS